MAPFTRADKRESQTCATARKFQDSEFTIDQDLGELVERGTIWGRLEEGQRGVLNMNGRDGNKYIMNNYRGRAFAFLNSVVYQRV